MRVKELAFKHPTHPDLPSPVSSYMGQARSFLALAPLTPAEVEDREASCGDGEENQENEEEEF